MAKAGDKRATEAILKELYRKVTGKKAIEEACEQLTSLMETILERPKRSYLPGLER